MEENCSIKLFESDLESMLSQVLAKARSRDEKLKAAKEKAVELKHQNETINDVLDLEKPASLTEEESKRLPTSMFRHIWHFLMSVTHKYTELTRSFSWRRFSD